MLSTRPARVPSVSYRASAQHVVEAAERTAAARGEPEVAPEHLLLALLDARDRDVQAALAALGVDPAGLRAQVEARLAPAGAAAGGAATVSAPALGAAAEAVLHAAGKEAVHLGQRQVTPRHVLIGLLYERDGAAAEVLEAAGVTLTDVRRAVMARPRSTLPLPLALPLPWPQARRTGDQPPPGLDDRQQRPRLVVSSVESRLGVSPLFLGLVGAFALIGAALWQGPPETPARGLAVAFVFVGWVISLCLHELGHALAAYLGGDDSVVGAGYLTLDPRRYSHPFLSVVLPVLFLLIGGLGLPGGAVYLQHSRLRGRHWRSLVAAAGPAATALCLVLLALPFLLGWHERFGAGHAVFWQACAALAFLQVTALLFNLLPVPTLDGFGIVEPLLPPDVAYRAYQHSQLCFWGIILLFMFTPVGAVFFFHAYELAATLNLPALLIGQGMDLVRFRGGDTAATWSPDDHDLGKESAD